MATPFLIRMSSLLIELILKHKHFMRIIKSLFLFSACCLFTATSVFAAGVPAPPVATIASNIDVKNYFSPQTFSFSATWNPDPNATGYMIDVATDPGFTNYLQVVDVVGTSFLPNTPFPLTKYITYKDLNLGNNTNGFIALPTCDMQKTYYYRLRSYNSYGTSAYSNVVTVKQDNTGMISNGIYTMRALAGAYLSAATSSLGKVTNSTTLNGTYTQWKFWHLGSDFYEIRSVALNERLEDPYGDNDPSGSSNDIATTSWGGLQPHILWKLTIIGNGSYMFIPLHKTTHALDANYGYGSVAHLWEKSYYNLNQIFKLYNIYTVAAKTIGDKNQESEDSIVTKLQIAPNPAKEFATVTWSSDESDVTLSIFDLSGKQVFATSVGGSSYQLNTTELSNGVYIVKLTSTSGTQTSRLVVQK